MAKYLHSDAIKFWSPRRLEYGHQRGVESKRAVVIRITVAARQKEAHQELRCGLPRIPVGRLRAMLLRGLSIKGPDMPSNRADRLATGVRREPRCRVCGAGQTAAPASEFTP